MASMKRNRPSFRNKPRRDWRLQRLDDPSYALCDTDEIPEHDVVVGDVVKLTFRLRDDSYGESMWVQVTSVRGRLFGGRLVNCPWVVNARYGQYLNFVDAHIKAHRDADGKRKVVTYDQDLPLAA